MLNNRPDITLIGYKKQNGFITDITVSNNKIICKKRLEKIDKYELLKDREIVKSPKSH